MQGRRGRVTDVLTGLYAAGTAVLACLHAGRRSGHGYAIDLALLDCAVAAQVNVVQAFLSSGRVPAHQGNCPSADRAISGVRDGRRLAGAWRSATTADGRRFRGAADRPDLAADPRFTTNMLRVQNRALLVPLVEALLRTRTLGDWQERLLGAAEVPHARWSGTTPGCSRRQAVPASALAYMIPAGNLWTSRARLSISPAARHRLRPCHLAWGCTPTRFCEACSAWMWAGCINSWPAASSPDARQNLNEAPAMHRSPMQPLKRGASA